MLIRGGQILRFLLRRFVKFYLNYWVIFLIFVPIGVFCFDRPLSAAYGEHANVFFSLVKDFLGLQKFYSYNITWWFNQIIIILWLIFPILYGLVKNRYTSWLLLLVAIVAFPVNALAFLLGVYVAHYREGIGNLLTKQNNSFVLAIFTVLLVLLCLNRECMYVGCLSGIKADPYIAIVLSIWVAILTKKVPYQFSVLSYLGKHSMNMYLVHTFIFAYFFRSFIYSFQNPVLIFFVLLFTSLGVSFVLETLKSRLGFYQLVKSLSDRLAV